MQRQGQSCASYRTSVWPLPTYAMHQRIKISKNSLPAKPISARPTYQQLNCQQWPPERISVFKPADVIQQPVKPYG